MFSRTAHEHPWIPLCPSMCPRKAHTWAPWKTVIALSTIRTVRRWGYKHCSAHHSPHIIVTENTAMRRNWAQPRQHSRDLPHARPTLSSHCCPATIERSLPVNIRLPHCTQCTVHDMTACLCITHMQSQRIGGRGGSHQHLNLIPRTASPSPHVLPSLHVVRSGGHKAQALCHPAALQPQ